MEAESGHGRYCLFSFCYLEITIKKGKEKRNHDKGIKAHFL